MIYGGIDPGANGGVSFKRSSEEKVTCFEIPKIGKHIDIRALQEILLNIKEQSKEDQIFFVLEDVGSIYHAGKQQTFVFGYNLAVVETLLVSLGIRYVSVQPKSWQKTMWEGTSLVIKNQKTDSKATSFAAARKWFPSNEFLKSKDGLYDAALMALYGQITYNLDK